MTVYTYHYTNFSRGWIIEKATNDSPPCSSWILLPAENFWHEGVRGFLYILAMLYFFAGICIASDVFMSAIEWITATKREVSFYDEEKGEMVTKEVYVWNETVANLSLMALGSSIPEILLAIGESASKLSNIDKGIKEDSLGLFTIIGSAAFNLLMIVGICIISVPSPEPKRIEQYGVFVFTCITSLWAYVWLLICAVYISPHVIEPWEAWVTFAFFPIMLVIAYCQDNSWWTHKCCSKNKVQNELPASVATTSKRLSVMDSVAAGSQRLSYMNIRVLSANPHGGSHVTGREIQDIQKDRAIRASRLSILSSASTASVDSRDRRADNFKIRRAGVAALTGRRARTAKMQHVEEVKANIRIKGTAENLGRFAFSSANYSVLESDGFIDLDVIYYRKIPLPSNLGNGIEIAANGAVKADKKKRNGNDPNDEEISAEPEMRISDPNEIGGEVCIDFETREGTGHSGHDYKHKSGRLTFKDGDYLQKIRIEIMDDYQYEADKDFYVILKNPKNAKEGLGDPSVARVTIIDDDEPGEFQFERSQFYGNEKSGIVTVTLIRKNGCDGLVTLDMMTTDATAKGGSGIKDSVDYQSVTDTVTFKHGEMKKTYDIKINKKSPPGRSFIVTLKNPSLGAKIGEHGGAVCFIGTPEDDLDDALADLVKNDNDDDEELGWVDQIKASMSVEEGEDTGFIDYAFHFFVFLWKVICALICPPRKYLGAYPTFITSLCVVGGMVAVVEQLGHLLGCVLKIRTAVTGITIVALGTSLPDTFASRTAALHDENADNSIGNVTGSNSVNVFLGLGIPWIISTSYALAVGKQYCVTPNNLFQSVVVFSGISAVAILILILRRFLLGGELGGHKGWKWATGLFFIILWAVYIVVASLKAYDIYEWNPYLPASVCTNSRT